jgi:hypothetical protein
LSAVPLAGLSAWQGLFDHGRIVRHIDQSAAKAPHS